MKEKAKRVLIIDDEVLSFINDVKDQFQEAGFAVDAALDGNEGVKKIKNNSQYDVILLDGYFGDRADGIKFLDEIKRITPTPVVCISSSKEIAEIMMRRGARGTLPKGTLFGMNPEEISNFFRNLE